jgi:hypothetical protein
MSRQETNGHNIRLLFSDLSVDSVHAGYATFVVPNGGPDFGIPEGRHHDRC